MSPFSARFFRSTQKRRLLLPKRTAALWEGTQWCTGGTGKAEAAKLPGAGISLKQCPDMADNARVYSERANSFSRRLLRRHAT